jgi:hypothetical protein
MAADAGKQVPRRESLGAAAVDHADRPGDGPGGGPVGASGVVASLAVAVMFAGLLLYILLAIWPVPTPVGVPPESSSDTVFLDVLDTATARPGSPAGPNATVPPPGVLWCTAGPAEGDARWVALPDTLKNIGCVSLFGADFPLWDEKRLLLLTLLGGALGGLIHALRSLAWYVGSRKLVRSWLGYYTSLPFVGALLAAAFYVVLRGGLFSGSTTIQDTSPFGFLAVSFLVGMFSTQAALKLKKVADTFFTAAEPGPDSAPQQTDGQRPGASPPAGPPIITAVTRESRAEGAAADALVIRGTGFTADSLIKVNQDEPRRPAWRSATELVLPLSDTDVKTISAGGDFVLMVQRGAETSQPHDFA